MEFVLFFLAMALILHQGNEIKTLRKRLDALESSSSSAASSGPTSA